MKKNKITLKDYMVKEKRRIIYGFLCTLMMGMSEVFTGAMLKLFTDTLSGKGSSFNGEVLKLHLKFSIKNIFNDGNMTLFDKKLAGSAQVLSALYYLCAAFLGIYLLKVLFDYLRSVMMNGAAEGMLRDFKKDLYAKSLRLSENAFSRRKPGDIVSRMTFDVMRLRELVEMLIEVSRSVIYIIIFLPLMFVLNWKLTLMTFVFYPVSVYMIDKLGKIISGLGKKVSDNVGEYTAYFEESLNHRRVINALGKESRRKQLFSSLIDKNYLLNLKLIKARYMLKPSNEFIGMLFLGVLFLILGRGFVHNGKTPGDIMLYLYFVKTSYKPLKKVAHAVGTLQVALVSSRKIFDFLDDEEDENRGGEITSPAYASMESMGLAYSYDGINNVFSGITVSIRSGDRLCVTGPSGAGKTTLLKIFAGLLDDYRGSVRFCGDEIRNHGEYAGGNALLLSSFDAYPGDPFEEISDNINGDDLLAGLRRSVAERHGADYSRMPNGARAALIVGCALARKPAMLLIDELCDFMDDELADRLGPLFEKVPIVVIVSARDSVISRCNSRLRL